MKLKTKIISLLLCVALLVTLASNAMIFPTAANEPSLGDDGEGSTEEWDLKEIVLNKYATDNKDGTYKLTVESYVTGRVQYEQTDTSVPFDVILLLDRSSSMGDSFVGADGKTTTRKAAAKTAVSNFLTNLGAHYSATTNHRVSLVLFGGEAQKFNSKQDWFEANATNISSLKSSVQNYTDFNAGATNPAAALTMANTLISARTGDAAKRNAVVILFTDGMPAASGAEYTNSYGEDAVKAANSLKVKNIDIFTIGIFDGADAGIMYATAEKYEGYFDHFCTAGAIGEYWENSGLFASSERMFSAAGNRFLNLVSSNYNTDNYGLSYNSFEFIYHSYKFTITALPGERNTKGDYYYTAKDATELEKVFTGISDWIAHGGTSVGLDQTAMIKDIVSSYFKLPSYIDDVSDIKMYTADCIGKDDTGYLWADPVDTTDAASKFKGVQATISDFKEENDHRDVSVTGFNFSENYVAYDEEAKKAHGTKLVIVFDIEPIEGFNGGNNVPTNDAASGIYTSEGKRVAPYPEPHVNIPIPKPSCKLKGNNFVVYYGNEISIDQLVEVLDIEDPLFDAYIDRTVKVGDAIIPDGIFKMTETVEYPEIEIILKPKYDPSNVGTEAKEVSAKTSETLTIHVLQPSVAVGLSDIEAYYGADHTLGAIPTPSIDVTWVAPANVAKGWEKKTESDASLTVEGVQKPFDADDIQLTYQAKTPFSGKVTKQPLTVQATAKFKESTKDFSDFTLSNLVKYSTTCAYGCTTPRTDGTYKVHSKTCDLTIVNNGGKKTETFMFTVLKDGAPFMTVPVAGASSIKLAELPVGTYTVIPDNTWADRYTTTYTGTQNTATLSATLPSGTVTFKNTAKSIHWIESMSAAIANVFGKGGTN